jgi:hypothetical protein
MHTVLNPIASEFASDEAAASYDRWFRAKVEQSLAKADDPATPRYSSDEVMRKVGASIHAVQTSHVDRSLA